MRKTAAVLLSAILLALPLAAMPVSQLARSGAVLTKPDSDYAFSANPAFLSEGEAFYLRAPLSLSMGNFTDIMTSGILDLQSLDEAALVESAMDILRSFNGNMDFLTARTSLELSVSGFGLSVGGRAELDTQSGSVDIGFVPRIALGLDWGYGHRWHIGQQWSVAAGFANHLLLEASTSPIDAESFVSLALDPSGWDISGYDNIHSSVWDVGVHAQMPLGFSAALVGQWDGDRLALDGALGWKGSWSVFSLALEIGMRDFNLIRDSVDLMKSLNASADISITRFISLSAGISQGYPSLGLDLRLLCFSVSLAWWYQDYGVVYALAPRDNLAVEIALRFD